MIFVDFYFQRKVQKWSNLCTVDPNESKHKLDYFQAFCKHFALCKMLTIQPLSFLWNKMIIIKESLNFSGRWIMESFHS